MTTMPIGHLTLDIPRTNQSDESSIQFQLVYLAGTNERNDKHGEPLAGQIATTAVLTNNDRSFALAVIPRTWVLDPEALEEEFGYRLRVADDGRAERLRFSTPLIFSAREQGIDVFVEQSLIRLPQVFMETEDPRLLIRLDGESFRRSFYGAWCGLISHAPGPIAAQRAERHTRLPAGNHSIRHQVDLRSRQALGAGARQDNARGAQPRMQWR